MCHDFSVYNNKYQKYPSIILFTSSEADISGYSCDIDNLNLDTMVYIYIYIYIYILYDDIHSTLS